MWVNYAIYDRYGHLVFQTTNPTECWDGRRNGINQNIGAYVYFITAKGICGPMNRQGTVMLER
jgi:gliding motility-associated-like protein